MTGRDEGMRPMDEHDWLAERFEENLGGWLTTVVARVSLNMLRSRASRREEPLDSHVPDPVISREEAIDPEDQALLAEGVGLALLVVLETLAPAERLAFVLHDMFAVPFEEIAAILGRSPTAARQLASRARRRVQDTAPVPNHNLSRQREVVDAFFAAARGGDFDALVAVLDPDVVLRSDGGVRLPAGPGERSPRSRRGPAWTAVCDHGLHRHAREDRRNRCAHRPRAPAPAGPDGPRRLTRRSATPPAGLERERRPQTSARFGSSSTMISVIPGRKQASRPHNSGLWPLLRATDIVKDKKITQKNTMISHQMNPIISPFLAGESHASSRSDRASESPQPDEAPAATRPATAEARVIVTYGHACKAVPFVTDSPRPIWAKIRGASYVPGATPPPQPSAHPLGGSIGTGGVTPPGGPASYSSRALEVRASAWPREGACRGRWGCRERCCRADGVAGDGRAPAPR